MPQLKNSSKPFRMLRHVIVVILFSLVIDNTLSAQVTSPATPDHSLGFTDTPGLPWHVHDPDRPHPPVVVPATTPGGPPSDATILFNGRDLSAWQSHASTLSKAGTTGAAPEWKLGDGYMEVVPHTGDLATKEKFGDIQLHVEWASPAEVTSKSQGRGNSGILLMGRYEVQVLDAWQNPTYADGQASAIYGQWPPLANPAKKPGERNTYDILFKAPRLDGDKVIKPAYITVLLQRRRHPVPQGLHGPWSTARSPTTSPSPPKTPSSSRTTTPRPLPQHLGPQTGHQRKMLRPELT